MRSCIALFLALLPSVVFCQDQIEVVAVSAPAVFTVEADSFTGALVSFSQVAASDPGTLLQTSNVMGELELVDEQKTKLTSRLSALAKEYQGRNAELSKSFDGSPASAERFEQARRKYEDGVKAATEDVLLPFQLDRLHQIRFQSAFRNSGSLTLHSGEFAELLDLTADQKTELKKKAAAAEEKLREEFQAQRQKAHRDVVKDVLTPKQLKIFDENFGKPMADVSK